MSETLTPTLPSAEARLVPWLVLAVLLHLGLFVIPARDAARYGDALAPLRISLTPARPASPEREAPADPNPAAPAAPDSALPPAVEAPPTAAEQPTTDASSQRDSPNLTAARLLDLNGRREWRLDESAGQRRFGVRTRQPLPDNGRSGLAHGDSRFDGRALPERIEIVDRWLAADGSHNVLVETPAGERLCGRAEAWDPLRPLVEPVMMFRSCGAASPTFEWPERYARPQRAGLPDAGQ